MPLVHKQGVAQRQPVGNGEIKRVVGGAEAEGALPQGQRKHRREAQGEADPAHPGPALPDTVRVFTGGGVGGAGRPDEQPAQQLLHPVKDQGEEHGADKHARRHHREPEQPVGDGGHRLVEPGVEGGIENIGDQIDAQAQVGYLPHPIAQGQGQPVPLDPAEQGEQQHRDDAGLKPAPVHIIAGDKAHAVALPVVERAEPQRGQGQQEDEGAGFELQAVFPEVAADEVVGDGVEAEPPPGEDAVSRPQGGGAPPGGVGQVEVVGEGGQHGEEKQGEHEGVLFLFAVQAVINEVQKGDQ